MRIIRGKEEVNGLG